MKTIHMVICDSGDGSNHTRWVIDPAVLEKMQERADEGDEVYASGDGLQVKTFKFPDDFDLEAWVKLNWLNLTTIDKV